MSFLDVVREVGRITQEQCDPECSRPRHRRDAAQHLMILVQRPALLDTLRAVGRTGPAWRRPRDARDAEDWLYDRAEEAAAVDLPLEKALQCVRDGYSSIAADRALAAEEAEDDD